MVNILLSPLILPFFLKLGHDSEAISSIVNRVDKSRPTLPKAPFENVSFEKAEWRVDEYLPRLELGAPPFLLAVRVGIHFAESIGNAFIGQVYIGKVRARSLI